MTTAPLPSPRRRRITLALCLLWLVAAALIVLSPFPADRGVGSGLRRVLAGLQRLGFPAWFDYAFVEFTANIVMFVPLGLFFFILMPRGWRWLGPVVRFGLSCGVELTQLVLLPQRVASGWDVLANTSGALIGTTVAWLLLRAERRR
ncbi:Predicted integral membrane protein [Arthrobacter agilis]|uniref:VanZ family protein n=1 Tax=Arthrobacter agilis TaxID=37921 RepID=UPI000F6D105E|nr:VanZ family protein [Arthrobacter agilis]VDR31538.1 Predicted integral membrane protein [Arthrobacter agilis]